MKEHFEVTKDGDDFIISYRDSDKFPPIVVADETQAANMCACLNAGFIIGYLERADEVTAKLKKVCSTHDAFPEVDERGTFNTLSHSLTIN